MRGDGTMTIDSPPKRVQQAWCAMPQSYPTPGHLATRHFGAVLPSAPMEPEESAEDFDDAIGTPVADIPGLAERRMKRGLPVAGVCLKSMDAEIATGTRPSGQRVVELYVSHYDNEDSHGEVIVKGAFEESIAERGPGGRGIIPFMWDHEILLGPSLEVKSDSKGVFQVGAIDDDRALDRYFAHAKSGAVKSGSIGFLFAKSNVTRETRNGRRVAVIQRAKMLEGSLAMFPANELAVVTAVKSVRRAALAAPEDSPASKSLWSLARALELCAKIRQDQGELAKIFEGEWWAPLAPEDLAIARAVLAAMPMLPAGSMMPLKSEEQAMAEAQEVIAAATTPAPDEMAEEELSQLSAGLDRLLKTLKGETVAA